MPLIAGMYGKSNTECELLANPEQQRMEVQGLTVTPLPRCTSGIALT